MTQIMTSRQTIAAKQRNCNYRPKFALAPHVLETTVAIESTEKVLEINGSYWVASKFQGRYYRTTVDAQGQWFCSARDERVAAMCKAFVQAYLVQPEPTQSSAAQEPKTHPAWWLNNPENW